MVGDVSPGRPRSRRLPRLPQLGGGRGLARLWLGLTLASAGLAVLTAILVPLRDTLALESVLLLYLLVVVVVAAAGGIVPAVIAAVAAVLLANFFFTTPFHTLTVDQRDSIIALIVFIVVALAVSVTVDLASRRRVAAARSRVEAELLSKVTGEPVGDTSVSALLRQVQTMFGMTSVALLEGQGQAERVVASVGPMTGAPPALAVDAGNGLRLIAEGPELFAEDRRMLARLAAAAARAWEGQQLAREAAQARELAEVDRLRSALLAAVGHDLKTPLSGIKAAVTSLRARDVSWTPADQEEFLATIEESADQLNALITNLLAMSRLEAGAMSVATESTALDEVVARVLLDLHAPKVEVHVRDDLPLVAADPGLLERVIANLVANARQFSPPDAPVTINAYPDGHGQVHLQVIDSGPGVPELDWQQMFAPFQRLDDRIQGIGLGLAIARGFTEAMHGTLSPSATPGGGLTMTISLPVAP